MTARVLLLLLVATLGGCGCDVSYKETADKVRAQGQRDPGEAAQDAGR